ncbi:MAG TPA: TRAP transporter substrate-binding protein [Rhodothermales bacterium]|nr:TRAP transporter substrate-binding protein [Rhodothermales bacterium]
MERRSFIKKAAASAATGGLIAACGGNTRARTSGPGIQAQPNVMWRLASCFPRSLDTIYGASEHLGKRLEALTGGRFRIRAYPAGELVPFDQVLDSVQKATVQIGHAASYYFIGKNPALAFDTCVPFGLTARQYDAWMQYGGGNDLMQELFADFNIVKLPGGNTGAQMGGWFRREINSAADLKGLKMRIPGMGGRVMDALGVNAQVIAGGEIYPALERGVIDAAEWVGPYDDDKLGFNKVAKYYYYPGWWEPGPALSFYVNKQAYDQLPTLYKEALASAAAEVSAGMLAAYDAKNPAALQRLLAGGTQLRQFPADVMDAAKKEADDQIASADTGSLYKRILEAHNKWREDSRRWFGTAELSYANYAYGPAGAYVAAANPQDCPATGSAKLTFPS